MSGITSPLTETEIERLAALEGVVAENLSNWIKVGSALIAIRDEKLWRDIAPSFEDYVQTRWDISRRRADQLIAANKTIESFENRGSQNSNIPQIGNERQARALSGTPIGLQADVLREAEAAAKKKGRKSGVTAADIRRVVSGRVKKKAGAEPSEGGPPWHSFALEAEQFAGRVRGLARELRDWLQPHEQTRRPTTQWAYFLTTSGTVDALHSVARHIAENLPGEECDKPPGYQPVRSVEIARAVRR